VYRRIQHFLEDLTGQSLADHRQPGHRHHILVISHNITIKTAMTIMRGLPFERLREGSSIPQATLIQAVYRPDEAAWTFPIC
jgi:broad specificity phosphatase PhoE